MLKHFIEVFRMGKIIPNCKISLLYLLVLLKSEFIFSNKRKGKKIKINY